MDITSESQRDRPALRVDRFSLIIWVLGFTIGPAGGRVPGSIVGFGGGLGLDLAAPKDQGQHDRQ
jgi:hypothetical protein